MIPRLYVVFCQPHYGNYQHWALQLKSHGESVVFQVVGQHPERVDGFIRKLYVGVLGDDDTQMVKEAAASIPVDNETIEWDCQDYVLEILDRLEEEYVLEKEDEDYQEAREELKNKRGGIL